MRIPFLESAQDETPANAGCHAPARTDADGIPLVAIVGNPNVGKSVLFNRLTGTYVTASNFRGTTVELSQGKGQFDGAEMAVVDPPGMYGLLPITEEERVARRILLEETPDCPLRSFVFRVGHSQFAVDEAIAADIYVRLSH